MFSGLDSALRQYMGNGQIFKLKAEVVPFDQAQANVALTAFARFGKGMGHRAQLNFGDCAVYALAQSRGEPVLAIGRDFRLHRYCPGYLLKEHPEPPTCYTNGLGAFQTLSAAGLMASPLPVPEKKEIGRTRAARSPP